MIKHVVLLKWKPAVSEEQIQAVGKGLAALKNAIPQIRSYEFGPDARIYKGEIDYSLVAEFACADDFKAYVKHEEHQRFMNEVMGPILDSYSASQFVLEKP